MLVLLLIKETQNFLFSPLQVHLQGRLDLSVGVGLNEAYSHKDIISPNVGFEDLHDDE